MSKANTCNRHIDCAAADKRQADEYALWQAGELRIPVWRDGKRVLERVTSLVARTVDHCYAEDCEDCFGN